MLGPDPAMKGGIASVVQSYLHSEYVRRVEVRYHATAVDGGKARKAAKMLASLATFPSVALSFRPDVVHIHHASRTSFYRKLAFLVLAKALRLRVVTHCHSGSFAQFHDASRVNAFFVRRFLDCADACITVSPAWRRVLAGYTRNPRIHVVPNPVDVRAFARGREGARPHARSHMTVLSLARVGEEKGTYDLLEAIPRVLEAVPEARFVLAGDGAVEEARRRACARGVDAFVETPGWVDGERKRRLVEQCDVYALPSHFEGAPVSILEAMAAGKAVVATRVGGIPEVVADGVNGYLVDPGDVRALAERLVALLRAPELRRGMGERNRAKVAREFSIHRAVDEVVAVYDSVTAGRARGLSFAEDVAPKLGPDTGAPCPRPRSRPHAGA